MQIKLLLQDIRVNYSMSKQERRICQELCDLFDPFGKSFQKISARYIEFCDSIPDRINVPAHLSISADCLPRDGRSVFRSGKWKRRDRSGAVSVAFPNFRSRETGRRMPVCDPQKTIRIYLTTCPMYNWRAAKFAPYQCKRRVYVKYFDNFRWYLRQSPN